jgi:2-methylaconitate cis-trans-isomerase PrpF
MKEQIRVPVTLMRGGTSKAVFLAHRDVPADPQARERFLLALFGSPDIRQIDGLGGADILTSKCAIIGPPSRPDADIDYTFVQIGIDQPTVSYEIVCGNISSATGVYALQEKLVPVQEPFSTIRVHNTNTGKILRMTVQCADGEPLVEGDCEVDGVPGTGAEVALDYSDTSGSATGKLLPTGQASDKVYVERLGKEITVSIVDVGTICVFIRAEDVGVTGTELPGQLDADIYKIADDIRRWTAERCNLDATALTPYQILIGPPQDYRNNAGDRLVRASEVDLVARMVIKDGVMHKAFPGGGSVCLSVAAQIPGTVPAEARASHASPSRIRIGHPSGVIGIYANVEGSASDDWVVREVHFTRTARRLFDGTAYIRRRLLQVT